MKINEVNREIEAIEMLIDTERQNVFCLQVALIEAGENPKNFDMMITGISIRLGEIQDRLNKLSLSEKAL